MSSLDLTFGPDAAVVGLAVLLFGIGREIYFRLAAQTGVARVVHKWSNIVDDEDGRKESYFLLCGLVENGTVENAETHLEVSRETWDLASIGEEMPVRYFPGQYHNLKPVGTHYLNRFMLIGLMVVGLGVFLTISSGHHTD